MAREKRKPRRTLYEPLGDDGWTQDGKPLPPDQIPGFACLGCDYTGRASELLELIDGDGTDPLRCPICETTGIVYG